MRLDVLVVLALLASPILSSDLRAATAESEQSRYNLVEFQAPNLESGVSLMTVVAGSTIEIIE